MLPALTNRGIEIFKMSTLASAVAYVELLQQGKLLASLNFNPIETYTVVAVVFFVLPVPAGAGHLRLERRLGGTIHDHPAVVTGLPSASARRGAARHRPRRAARRPHRDPRCLGLGQEHAACAA
jgi:hypothetical protein